MLGVLVVLGILGILVVLGILGVLVILEVLGVLVVVEVLIILVSYLAKPALGLYHSPFCCLQNYHLLRKPQRKAASIRAVRAKSFAIL